MKRIFSVWALVILFAVSLQAKDNFEEKFKEAKQLFLSGRFNDAMNAFLPLTKEASGNNYVQASQYFYSLSAFKDKKMQEAYYMLLQLIQKYPTWNNIEEVYYLAAITSFELKKYRYALNFLKDRSPKLQKDIDDMKVYHLGKLQPLDSLITIQKSYSKDPVIASVLATRLNQSRPLSDKNNMLLQYLVQEYKLPSESLYAPSKPGELKSSYNVAVLFPFMINSPDYDNHNKTNPYITELYQGILIAIDSLKQSGTNINLIAYDTEKDNGRLGTLLQSPELKTMDMAIGPLLPTQNNTVGEFAIANQIEVVNPLSNNSKLFDRNNFVYLFQPTLESQAGEVARFAEKNLSGTQRTKVAIFFGDTGRDSLLAMYYRDSLVSRKIQVPIFERIKKDKLFRMTSALSDSTKLNGFSHVFISSADEVIAANVISALEKSMTHMPIITRSEWLQLSTLSLEQLQKRNIHFISPDFVDYDNPALSRFKKEYIAKYNIFPSPYVFCGYELMNYFGNVLKNNGTNFQEAFSNTSFSKGSFYPGMDFRKSNTNRYVPIVKFEGMKLKVMNPIEDPAR